MSSLTDSVATALKLILAFDAQLLAIVGRSLAVSAMALVLASVGGLVLGAWLGVARFAGRGAVLAVLNTLLAVPSVVVGLVVYLLLSRSGPLGFRWGGCFQLQGDGAGAGRVGAARGDCADAPGGGRRGARPRRISAQPGARPLLRSLLLMWDERFALLTVLIASFGRAISEVGAVMIVGGNIDGFTRVMTTAIALETSKGDLPLALALGLVLLAVVLLLNAGVTLLQRWRRSRGETGGLAWVP